MLILYGFGFVSIPLIGALIYAAVHMERLADQSQDAVHQAVRATQHSNQVLEQITSMERRGRQYLVLKDPGLLQAFRESHQHFQRTVGNLKGLSLDDHRRALVIQLLRAERAIFNVVSAPESNPQLEREVAAAYSGLTSKAEQLLRHSNQLINEEVDVLRNDASKAQEVLFWLAASLIPLSLASAAVFTALISRPIRQVDQSIRDLGEGEFSRPIRVGGPEDLRYIGDQLDWLRQRLQELEQEKTRFLRHVSHELKTPLTAIREGAELVGERSVGGLNPQQEEIVRIIHGSVEQLQDLIEDLLNFSTVQVGPPRLDVSQTDLAALVREVVESHKPTLMAKGLELDTLLEPVPFNGDREKLKTVVDNLLSNAIKFSPEGGNLSVSVRASGEEALLDVVDSGPGVEETDTQRVFDAFYQGEHQAEGYIKGSGLGLSISREYVNAHKGAIRLVDSEQTGAHFRVTLPRNNGLEAT
jgi:two-component system sensor histidine kinase GlrK